MAPRWTPRTDAKRGRDAKDSAEGEKPRKSALSHEGLPRLMGGNPASKVHCNDARCTKQRVCWFSHARKPQ